MSINPNNIIKRPVITEESTIQTEAHNQYIFRVDPKANKAQIREAVEQLFKVNVAAVNTMNYMGKMGRRAKGVRGRRPSWKKAVVTLRAGEKIELL